MSDKQIKVFFILRNVLFCARCVLIVLLIYLCFEAADGRVHDTEFMLSAYFFFVGFLAELALGRVIYDHTEENEQLTRPEFVLFRIEDKFEWFMDGIEPIIMIALIIAFIWGVSQFIPFPFFD